MSLARPCKMDPCIGLTAVDHPAMAVNFFYATWHVPPLLILGTGRQVRIVDCNCNHKPKSKKKEERGITSPAKKAHL